MINLLTKKIQNINVEKQLFPIDLEQNGRLFASKLIRK